MAMAVTATLFCSAGSVPAQTTAKQYAVKFICGQAEGDILARGTYTTAINIQNPNQDPSSPPVTYEKRIAVALPGEQSGGMTGFLTGKDLAPGEAVEFDCPDILENAPDLCRGNFCKGFVTLQSNGDLEVVAVYSAEDPDTKSVRSIHTDRATTAERCPVRTERVGSQTILFVPPHTGGDKDFKDHGPCVRFDLDLRTINEGTSLVANYSMHAFECSDDFASPKSDFTAAQGEQQITLFSAGPQSRILGYDLANSMTHNYIDTDHAEDVFNFGGSNPVQTLRYIGDTSGDEAGSETRVRIQFRDLTLSVESCGPQER